MSSVDRKTYMAKLRLNEMLADHDVSLPADLYDEIAAALREQPEARGVVDDAMVERALYAVVASLGNRQVAEYILDGGRRFWSPSGWEANVRHVVRAILTAAQQPVQEGGGEVCPRCKGAGEYEGFARHASGDPQDEYAATVQCEPCEGTGEVSAPPSAPVGVLDDALLDRLASEVYQVHCDTPIRAFPNDTHWPKWRAVVQHVANAITQQPAQAAPGWKLVPVEPTMEMRSGTGIHHVHAENVWRAMLAAAPTPPGNDAAGGKKHEGPCWRNSHADCGC